MLLQKLSEANKVSPRADQIGLLPDAISASILVDKVQRTLSTNLKETAEAVPFKFYMLFNRIT